MLADLRAAWRSLAKSPGFAAVAVLALGLGLALSTTMFGVIDAVLKPQSPYRNIDRLYGMTFRISVTSAPFDPRNLLRMVMQQTRSFDASVPEAYTGTPASVGPDAQEFGVLAVPPRWFDVVGARPSRGRAFVAADGLDVALVNQDVWRILSGGRRSLSGAHVVIGDRLLPVVGVLPRGSPSVVIPASDDDTTRKAFHLLRLAPGVSRERAQAELDAQAGIFTARYGTPDAPWSLALRAERDVPEQIDNTQKAMVAAALAVLLIGCVNLAHLMLARGLARRRELAIRMALGVGRAAAIRHVLAEGLLVLAGGVALGAVGALWGSGFAQSLMPPDIRWISSIRFQLSWRVFVLGGLAAAVSGIFFGLLPAIRVTTSVDLTDPLKTDSGTTTGGRHWRYSPLVITEVALALALLMSGGLLLRSVDQLRSAPLGFDAATLLSGHVRADFRTRSSPGTGRTDTLTVDWAQALAAARGVAGVRDAALQGDGRTVGGAVTAELTGDTARVINTLGYAVVSPSYLRVHGLPILKGRDFAPGDAAGNGVAILSAVAAARLYPRRDPVGHMLKLGSPKSTAPWIPIVGVARTPIVPWEEQSLAGGEPVFWVVRPPSHWWSATLLVRAEARRPRILIDLRRTLRALPLARYVSVRPFNWERDAEIASRDFLAKVFVAMGGVGLALAALGLYAVLAHAVTRRMREFGVRLALGAEPRVLYRMVMHDGLVMLLAGTGIGAFVALGSAYLLNAVLIGVYPTDAVSLVAAEAVLIAVGLAATLAPARRAVRANPLEILRAV
jgi:putative ABC transport system permease protein